MPQVTGDFSLAVHALVYLAHRQVSLSSEVLAGNICTNSSRVRRVMAPLKRAGFVSTKEGFEGGYTFIGNAGQVTLRQVAEAVSAQFVSPGWRSGGDDMECLIASGMAQVMDHLYTRLNRNALEYLEHITIADIDQQIFGEHFSQKHRFALQTLSGPGK